MYYNREQEEQYWEAIHETYYNEEEFTLSHDHSIDVYLEAGFDAGTARRWRDIDCPSLQAEQFRHLGVTPEEAVVLKTTPVRAWAYLSTGVTAKAAREWIEYYFEPEEVDVWWRAGWGPAQARHLMDLYSGAKEAAIVWAFTGLSSEEAIRLAKAGKSPVPFLPLPNCDIPELDAPVE